MEKIYFLLALSISSFSPTLAQDKNDIAKALYAKAESSYTSEKYDVALKYLNDCENTLGSTNSKILYLKVNALNNLFIEDKKYLPELNTALSKFFEVTDKTTYPEEKYSEIINIKLDIPDKTKKREELYSAYSKLKSSNNTGEFEDFFKKYPSSKYEEELRILYDKLFDVGGSKWDLTFSGYNKHFKIYFTTEHTVQGIPFGKLTWNQTGKRITMEKTGWVAKGVMDGRIIMWTITGGNASEATATRE